MAYVPLSQAQSQFIGKATPGPSGGVAGGYVPLSQSQSGFLTQAPKVKTVSKPVSKPTPVAQKPSIFKSVMKDFTSNVATGAKVATEAIRGVFTPAGGKPLPIKMPKPESLPKINLTPQQMQQIGSLKVGQKLPGFQSSKQPQPTKKPEKTNLLDNLFESTTKQNTSAKMADDLALQKAIANMKADKKFRKIVNLRDEKIRSEIEKVTRTELRPGYKEPGIGGQFVESFKQSSAQALAGIGATLEMIGNMSGMVLLGDSGGRIRERWKKTVVSNPEWNEPSEGLKYTDPKKYSRLLGGAVPSLLGGVATGVAATLASGGNVPVGVAATVGYGFALEGGSSYQEAKDKGETEQKAQEYGTAVGAINGILEAILPAKYLKKIGTPVYKDVSKSLMKTIVNEAKKRGIKILENGTIEGSTEVVQQFVANAVAKNYDKNRKLWDGMLDSFLGGFLSGGGLGVVEGDGDIAPDIPTTNQKGGVVEFTPDQAQAIVVGSNLENTPIGKEIVKSAIQAEQEGKNIVIDLKVGADGELKTPGGVVANAIELVDPNESQTEEASSIKDQTLYRGSKGEVVEVKKSFDNILNFPNDQHEVIADLAKSGDPDAQAINEKFSYVEADKYLREKFKDQYDAIRYENQHLKAKGIEYADLKTGEFFSEQKETASVYATASRNKKYDTKDDVANAGLGDIKQIGGKNLNQTSPELAKRLDVAKSADEYAWANNPIPETGFISHIDQADWGKKNDLLRAEYNKANPKIFHATSPENVHSMKQMGVRGDLDKLYFASDEVVGKNYGKGVIALPEKEFKILEVDGPGVDLSKIKAQGYDGVKYRTTANNFDYEIFNKEKLNKLIKETPHVAEQPQANAGLGDIKVQATGKTGQWRNRDGELSSPYDIHDIVVNGKKVGEVSATKGKDGRLFVSDIEIDDALQRKGIGSKAIQDLVDKYDANGVVPLVNENKPFWSKVEGFKSHVAEQPKVDTVKEEPEARQFDKQGNEITDKKIKVLTGKQVEAIRDIIRDKLDRLKENADTPEAYHTGIKEIIKYVREKADNDKQVLSAFRTELNQEMYGLAGGSNYKEQFQALQGLKLDPELGPVIETMETEILNIDELLLTSALNPAKRSRPSFVENKVVELKGEKPKTVKQKLGEGDSKETPVGTGRTKNSRLFERIKETLGEEYENTEVKYNVLDLEKQATAVTDLIENDPDAAIKVARGLIEPPPGMTQNAVAVGLSHLAITQGDMKMAAEMWTKTSLRSTRLGQEIVSLRGSFGADSPMNAVRRIIDYRIDKVAKRYKGIAEKFNVIKKASAIKKVDAVVKEQATKLKKQMTEQQKRIQSAQEIINALTCK